MCLEQRDIPVAKEVESELLRCPAGDFRRCRKCYFLFLVEEVIVPALGRIACNKQNDLPSDRSKKDAALMFGADFRNSPKIAGILPRFVA